MDKNVGIFNRAVCALREFIWSAINGSDRYKQANEKSRLFGNNSFSSWWWIFSTTILLATMDFFFCKCFVESQYILLWVVITIGFLYAKVEGVTLSLKGLISNTCTGNFDKFDGDSIKFASWSLWLGQKAVDWETPLERRPNDPFNCSTKRIPNDPPSS